VYAGGRGGQRVYVLPNERAVVVRIGRIRNDFDDGKFLNPFIAALSAPR
jgi:CubicO group peptidase (beta-lactamase class C family)